MLDVTKSAHHIGDCRALLAQLPDACVQTCITSPPYWGLRDYGLEGQLGLEDTPEQYIDVMVDVFRGVRRVLRDDGTLWLNIGDSYAGSRSGPQGESGEMHDRQVVKHVGMRSKTKGIDPKNPRVGARDNNAPNRVRQAGLKHKDLVGIPWMLAFALRADGWYLRCDIIWSKPNPMPESVRDRPTKAHEYLFLLSKSPTYYYDADSTRTALASKTLTTFGSKRRSKGTDALGKVAADNWTNDVPVRKPKLGVDGQPAGANLRSVWTCASQPYAGAHFAVFPPRLIRPCVLAGSRPGDLVLDVFHGSGTTGMVAQQHGRRWIGFDLGYAALAAERTSPGPLFSLVSRDAKY
jgi:DNA modification methylase